MKTSSRINLGLFFLLPCFGLASFVAGCDGESSAPPDDPPELPAEIRADLQATIDSVVASGTTPGAVLHVSGPDGSWSGAAGVAEIDGSVPLSPDDRFRAGSMLKSLVAAAVLQSIEKGSLGLNDLLADRLPADVASRIPNADGIDIGMLLGHRSGIAEWLNPAVRNAVVADPAHVWSLDEILDQIDGKPPMFEPGERFGYSNTNYILLGEILTAVEGKSWREVIRERVIAPSGMDDTTLPDPGDIECSGCAHGYIPIGGDMLDATRVDPSMAGASGGHALISTAADMGRFLEHLRTGALFARAETVDTMFAFQPATDPDVPLIGYGLGVMQIEDEDHLAVGHLGGTAGYQSFTLYLPATGRYVSGFINVLGNPGPVILPVMTRLSQP